MENVQNPTTAIAGVCRQLSNAYLNFSNVNVLLASRNVIVTRLATLVAQQRLLLNPPLGGRENIPARKKNVDVREVHKCF